MKDKKEKFCRKCGKEVIFQSVFADAIEVFSYDSMGGSYMTLASSYDPVTGKRKMAVVRKCPDHKRGIFGNNRHDISCEYKGEIMWSIKVKRGNNFKT